MTTRAIAVSILVGLVACANNPTATESPGASGCPGTLDEASAMEVDESAFVGAGHVIRFVPAADLGSRGYDVNIVRRVTDSSLDIVFLRAESPLTGVEAGQSVLMVAERTDDPRVFRPGACPPLVVLPEAPEPQ